MTTADAPTVETTDPGHAPSDIPQGMSECCFRGFLHEGTPTGSVIKVGGLDTYLATPEAGETDKAVVLIHDVFGWSLPNTRLIADRIAKDGGYRVYLPDFFNGDSPSREFFEKVFAKPKTMMDRLSTTGTMFLGAPSLMMWFGRHKDSVTVPLLDAVFKDLRENHGVKRIGAIGYCWGGRYVVLAAAKGLTDVFVPTHPSGINLDKDIPLTFDKPGLFCMAEKDFTFGPDVAAKAKAMYAAAPGGSKAEFILYPGTEHGFAVRGDMMDDVARKAALKAVTDQVAFFKAHL
ncbi:hypothetical protein HK105_201436 [Polyrhizophydium stewartii]|uniref:Dienelactone hydrolase domain-containing protein n=1 Tax=Polyrhizophydium stewartii TaxID=2732419 RepID=A0ABR4NI11_9FUNG|nr:hypothetical protein HK105_003209 [Polyrhizophydium stewartii]